MIPSYVMYGKTTRVFPFAPNWESPVNETLEWKTNILRSFSGNEQRRALRMSPRRGFEYKVLLKNLDTRLLENLLWGWQARDFALPVWTDCSPLLSTCAAGSTSLPISTGLMSFRAGDFAILFASSSNYEVVELTGVSSSLVDLKAATGNTWPAGTKVYPLILSHLASSVGVSRHTDSVVSAPVAFASSPDTAFDFITPGSPSSAYDGIELLTHRPNWGSAIQNDFTRAFEIVDAGVGPVGYYPSEKASRIARPFHWFLKSRAEIVAFRDFMGRLQGQAKTCWIPSWHTDFTLAASNGADRSILTVAGVDFHTLVGVDTSRDRLAIRLPNGTMAYRRIVSSVPDYGLNRTNFQLDSALNTTIGVLDNVRLQLLLRCRLATDKVVIPWQTTGFAAPQTTFTTVKL